MRNSQPSKTKFSGLELMLNKIVIGTVFVISAICLLLAILSTQLSHA